MTDVWVQVTCKVSAMFSRRETSDVTALAIVIVEAEA
jgi:hypothetical protein